MSDLFHRLHTIYNNIVHGTIEKEEDLMSERFSEILLKVSEVVEMTGLCRSKVYLMIASGELPSIRFGRAVRVPAEGLRALIRRNTRNYSE